MHFTRQARRLRRSALAGPLIQVGQLLLWCIGFYPMGEIGEIARSAPYPLTTLPIGRVGVVRWGDKS